MHNVSPRSLDRIDHLHRENRSPVGHRELCTHMPPPLQLLISQSRSPSLAPTRAQSQHDRHPMSIIDLLRIASMSPDLLWYVRVLEFYGSRSSWEQWRTYYDYRRMQNEPKVNLTCSGPHVLSELGLEMLFQNHGLQSFMHDCIERVKKGDDEPLKAILIASCPSLQKVTWVAHAADDHQPYSLLCDLISACQSLPHSVWPQGFLSLRSISLGACTEHVHPHDNLHPDVTDFCRLLLLPNLKSLRINVGGYGDSDLQYLNTHVPERSSTVEQISVHICDFDQATIVTILKRFRSLKFFLDIYLGPWTNILEDIQPCFGDSLEELRPEGDNNYELRLYGPMGIYALSGFPNLRVFNIYVGDLISEDFTEDSLPAIGRGKKVEWHEFHAVLPPVAEDIIFLWPPRNHAYHFEKYNLHKTLFLDFFEQLDGFVRLRGRNNGGCLKKIYLDLLPKQGPVQGFGEVEADEFQRLVDGCGKCWGEAGVEVISGERKGVGDEVLECRPTAIEWRDEQEMDNDSD